MAKKKTYDFPGRDALWGEMSYTSWLTLPRALMHEMPDDWQAKMAKLLEEYFEVYDFEDIDLGTRVQCTKDGKLVRTPPFLLNYRHPDTGKIRSLMRKKENGTRSGKARKARKTIR